MPEDIVFEEDQEVDIVVDNDIDDNQDAEDELLGDDGGEGIADSDAIDIIIAQDGEEDFCYEADYDDGDLCDGSEDEEPDNDSEDDPDEEPDGDENDDLDESIDDENQNEYEDYDSNF